jgi:hypothetical protein
MAIGLVKGPIGEIISKLLLSFIRIVSNLEVSQEY